MRNLYRSFSYEIGLGFSLVSLSYNLLGIQIRWFSIELANGHKFQSAYLITPPVFEVCLKASISSKLTFFTLAQFDR